MKADYYYYYYFQVYKCFDSYAEIKERKEKNNRKNVWKHGDRDTTHIDEHAQQRKKVYGVTDALDSKIINFFFSIISINKYK